MKNKYFKIFRIIGYLIGFSVLFYPIVSNYINVKNATQVISDYENKVNEITDKEKEKILELAKAYNHSLQEYNNILSDPFLESENIDNLYEQILNINGKGMMGYIRIPKIKVELPIYHGTSEQVLQVGVGHLANSSLPIGGTSTHAVLTGHRGLPSAKLFTELDKLEIGDVFYLKNLGKTMAYEVDQILTVLPTELESLTIVDGQDYVSLVTCTPYAVNTHRLIVRGHRIDYQEALQKIPDNKVDFELPFELKVLMFGIAGLIAIVLIIKKYSKKGQQ